MLFYVNLTRSSASTSRKVALTWQACCQHRFSPEHRCRRFLRRAWCHTRARMKKGCPLRPANGEEWVKFDGRSSNRRTAWEFWSGQVPPYCHRSLSTLEEPSTRFQTRPLMESAQFHPWTPLLSRAQASKPDASYCTLVKNVRRNIWKHHGVVQTRSNYIIYTRITHVHPIMQKQTQYSAMTLTIYIWRPVLKYIYIYNYIYTYTCKIL